MKEDEWIAFGVAIFVMIAIGLICFLGLTGFFSL